MKQKFTLKIADMSIDVVTEESAEYVNNIVSALDRKIREITLNSRHCSKHEAALICALDLCSDKLQLTSANKDLEAKVTELEAKVSALEAKNAKLEAKNAKLREETKPEETANPAEEVPAQPTEPADKKGKSKSKVGSMFDLLTFTDI